MESPQLEEIMATVHALLLEEGMREVADLVRNNNFCARQIGYDNWNGGIEIWEVLIEVSPRELVHLGPRKSQMEEQISARLKMVLERETENWYSAKIVPERVKRSNWREEGNDLPRQTRINILDGLRLEDAAWYGELNDVEFLSRIFDLQTLPSYDIRYKDAASDIWQHCINNEDWERDWVFTDDRFNLLDGPADIFLRFLCEMVHPIVRPSRSEAFKLVSHFNDQLHRAGWEIREEERIAGRPRFAYCQVAHGESHAVSRAKTVADALDAGWMAKEIERLENAVDRDPALAIGTAKDLVESCCKTILSKRSVSVSKSDDLGDITKKLTKELLLVPEGITDEAKGAEAIRLILRNLTQLTSNLARIRGLYGSGHGRDGQHRGLQPRHARLAVTSAVAFIDFVAETYRYREAMHPKEDADSKEEVKGTTKAS
ncbi:abortive infection family protein [Alloalcanivorax xenomutans]|jgi:hypothetical protein|uniref:abortive infection family protein n=1 Tax=Alloalcanivorax xenomutans TaxID=1094342 RepID=UPI000E2230C3